ncbi:hypothetical protein Tco_1297241, partial [Tanacetum coccineum]
SDCLVRLYNSFGRCTLGNRRQVLLHDIHARFLDYKMVDSKSVGNKKDKKKNDKKGKGKSEYLAPKAGIVKQKF